MRKNMVKHTNVIVLYGPPAVGKLAVANELSRITGYKVLHNHLTLDFVTSIFGFGGRKTPGLVDKYRIDIIREAVDSGIEGLILTFVYGNTKGDDKFINDIIKAVERGDGRVLFCQLKCSIRALKSRIGSASRKRYNKIRSAKKLDRLFSEYDVLSPIKSVNSYILDNTHLSPKRAAMAVKKHYDL